MCFELMFWSTVVMRSSFVSSAILVYFILFQNLSMQWLGLIEQFVAKYNYFALL
jgi:hypothetical protein